VILVTASSLAQPGKGNSANPRVLPPHSHPLGKTYGEWAVAWWQWALSIPEAYRGHREEGLRPDLQKGIETFGALMGGVHHDATIGANLFESDAADRQVGMGLARQRAATQVPLPTEQRRTHRTDRKTHVGAVGHSLTAGLGEESWIG
jgi:hypothetical protein